MLLTRSSQHKKGFGLICKHVSFIIYRLTWLARTAVDNGEQIQLGNATNETHNQQIHTEPPLSWYAAKPKAVDTTMVRDLRVKFNCRGPCCIMRSSKKWFCKFWRLMGGNNLITKLKSGNERYVLFLDLVVGMFGSWVLRAMKIKSQIIYTYVYIYI